MKNFKTLRTAVALAAAAAASLALTGCFGGGDDDPAPPADPLAAVPDTAVQSVAGTVDYQLALNKNQSDTREPIDVTSVVLPTSDTTEPAAIE